MKNVLVTLNPGLGANLGPTFSLTSNGTGAVTPANATLANLLTSGGGVLCSVPDDTTLMYITSIGNCTNVLTLGITGVTPTLPPTTPAPTLTPTLPGAVTLMPTTLAVTLFPTLHPTIPPTLPGTPTDVPTTLEPTVTPTMTPTAPGTPTDVPTTMVPTVPPTVTPTLAPTLPPTLPGSPTLVPTTLAPTLVPTTAAPTTLTPTLIGTPTDPPTIAPTVTPTAPPTYYWWTNMVDCPTFTGQFATTSFSNVDPIWSRGLYPRVTDGSNEYIIVSSNPYYGPTNPWGSTVVGAVSDTGFNDCAVPPTDVPTFAPTLAPTTATPTLAPTVTPTITPTDPPYYIFSGDVYDRAGSEGSYTCSAAGTREVANINETITGGGYYFLADGTPGQVIFLNPGTGTLDVLGGRFIVNISGAGAATCAELFNAPPP